MTEERRQELMKRLEAAIRYHRENPVSHATREYSRDLALKFGVNRKTMANALQIMAQKGIK